MAQTLFETLSNLIRELTETAVSLRTQDNELRVELADVKLSYAAALFREKDAQACGAALTRAEQKAAILGERNFNQWNYIRDLKGLPGMTREDYIRDLPALDGQVAREVAAMSLVNPVDALPTSYTARQVLEAIDAWAAKADSDGRYDLWHILTALRGPDDPDPAGRVAGIKSYTTGVLRNIVLPTLARLALTNPKSPLVHIDREDEDEVGTHFVSHFRKAVWVLQRLYTDNPQVKAGTVRRKE